MNIISNLSATAPAKFQKHQYGVKQNTIDENNSQKLENELQKTALINQTIINFKGKGFKLNKNDLLFISGIVSSFGLSTIIADKLKNTLSNFLQDKNFTSMDDMQGPEFIEEQSELIDNLNQITKFEGDDYNRLMDKMIERCNPIETELLDDEIDEFEKFVENSITAMRKNDEKCLDKISFAFGFNKEQKEKLYKIVRETLDENNIMSLKHLSLDDNIEAQAILSERIADGLNLTMDQSLLVDMEITNRSLSPEIAYDPVITPFDVKSEFAVRDKHTLNQILERYGIKNIFDKQKLEVAMKNDAYNNNLPSLFDLFKSGNKLEQFVETDNVLSREPFAFVKVDLLIDFNTAARNMQKVTKETEKQEKQNDLCYKKAIAINCHLNKKMDFTKDEVKAITSYFKANNYDLTDRNNIAKAAYELSGMLDRTDKYQDFIKAIEEVNQVPEEELVYYSLDYCKLLMDKK